MTNLHTIQQDIAALPPDTQQIIFDLVEVLKKCEATETETEQSLPENDWSDFIGCIEAEPDLATNYKTYLNQRINEKYSNHWYRIFGGTC